MFSIPVKLLGMSSRTSCGALRAVQNMIVVLVFLINSVSGMIKVISVDVNDTSTDVYTVEDRGLILKSSNGLMGNLIKAEPPDACTAVQSPPDVNGTYYGSWILLATWEGVRDPCPLLRKIRNADLAGYLAIIIQRPPGNESDFIPDFDTSDWYGVLPSLSIFPCLVSYEDGRVLGTNFTSEDYILKFEDEPINTWLGFFIASILVILAILLAIGLSYVIVQMFVLILLWIRETVVNAIQQRRRDRRRRLPPSQLKRLPVQQYTTDIPQDTCTICLDQYAPDDKIRVLPCSHVFHMVCIDPWLLNQRRKCPNCKGKIVFPDERYDSDTSTEDERTPLIRRGSDRNQIFTFNENEISRNPPLYTAIHRIFDEAASLPRPLDNEQEPRPAPVRTSSSVPTNGESSMSTRFRHFISFKPRFGRPSPEATQPIVHTSASTSSASSSPENPCYGLEGPGISHIQNIQNLQNSQNVQNNVLPSSAGQGQPSTIRRVGNLTQAHLIDAEGNEIIEELYANESQSEDDVEEGSSLPGGNNVQTNGSTGDQPPSDSSYK